MPDILEDKDKSFYYNSGFQDGYHRAMDKVREFLFESYTVPVRYLVTSDNESIDTSLKKID